MSGEQAIEALKAERDRLYRDIEMKNLALDNARSIWEQKRDRLRAEKDAEIARAVARERDLLDAIINDLTQVLDAETRRAEDAHGEAQRWALQVESLRAEKEELKERCAKAADKVDTVNGIGDIIRRLP